VPTLVIFPWAAAVTLWAVPTVETFVPLMLAIADPFEAINSPETVRTVSVPTLVIFPWAAAVTLWAVPTVETFVPLLLAIADPFEAISFFLQAEPGIRAR
jgi:hypothetical protein